MRRPSPALVVACIALLVALTGTSYATVLSVPRNSVGTAELKRDAVKPAKLAPNAVRTGHVLNGSLLAADFKSGQLPAGAKGDKGDKGDKGAKGDPGELGAPGLSGVSYQSVVTASNATPTKATQANCPGGKRVIGGGAFTTGSTTGTAIRNSSPLQGGTGWIGVAAAITPQPNSWALNVVAVCATTTP
ncbi:MAG: hypothetical protein R6W48_11860 [Gaiellaceae bacterium]